MNLVNLWMGRGEEETDVLVRDRSGLWKKIENAYQTN